jgi:prolyl-tRNA editing enzyme YbaK/EbsC (Cys-tRNA(Pro) deacylase)
MLTFIDQDLLQYPEIWAAAGTPNAVFRMQSQDLTRICTGVVVKIT